LFSLSLGPHWVIFVNGIDTLKDVFVKKEAYFSDRPDVYFFTHIKGRKGMAFYCPTYRLNVHCDILLSCIHVKCTL
jgi:hypothetical protein